MNIVERDTQKMYNLLMMLLSKYMVISKHPIDYGGKAPFYPAEIHLMEFIGNNPGCTLKDIATFCAISQPAASRVIGKLEKRSLVQKQKPTPQRREITVYLTESGQALTEGHERYHMEHKNEHFLFFRALNEHDRNVVIDFLDCYNHSLEKFVK